MAASRPDPTREPKPLSLAKTTPFSSRLCFPFPLPFSAKTTPSPASFPSPSSASFPSPTRFSGRKPAGDGPALVGQVFSMCDLSGTGLMAVSTHFDIPFISQRTPEWLKKIFASITRSERKGPVFRFFLDLSDAVSYVKRLNIPSGVVGACRLDLAYEHFKEKPHLFQFVPNEKQVKEANKLLKAMPRNSGSKKVEGVPVFSAQNLDMAIATTDGIKWYTPYFFDKGVLDNILEESVDQHFQSLIQTRHMQRRGDVIDDDFGADVMEEMGDNALEPPEVQEVMEEMGNPGIPLSVISKAAEIQLLYAVDQMLLGNRWLRKATGIQPKFPYMVDSFEKRSAASILRASTVACLPDSEMENLGNNFLECKNDDHSGLGFGQSPQMKQSLQRNVFLPKITMVGVSPGESGQTNKASLKKTMDDLTEELEQIDRGNDNAWSDELRPEERDPLFVANMGDSYAGLAKTGQSRWVRGGDN